MKSKIEELKNYISELEEFNNKKSKKKLVECVNCLKKDVEIQSLTATIDKVRLYIAFIFYRGSMKQQTCDLNSIVK